MANVDRDRGQLIIVTGLMIALAMVALVLLLNTAIYTENLASRGVDQSGREAMEYRRTTIDGVGVLIDLENDREHSEWSDVRENVSIGIEIIDNRTSRNYALGGASVQISLRSGSPNRGRLLRQNSSRPFESNSSSPDWQLADSVEDTRAFSLTANRSSLEQTNQSAADGSGAFRVKVDDGTAWNAYIYQNRSNPDNVTIASGSGGSVTEHCRVDASNVTVNLTAGTVGGEACPGFKWAEGVSPGYTIEFENGDNATGTYNLTVNTTTISGLNERGPSPYYVPAVYSVSLNLTYESPTLSYRTKVRVAPGETE